MKLRILCLLSALALLLAGCAEPNGAAAPPETPAATPSPLVGPVDEPPWFATYRVVDHYDSCCMLLAENDGGPGAVYSLGAGDLDLDAPILDGDLINVYFEMTLESYPAQFGGLAKVEHTDTERDDRCGLYLQVLEDLWAVDPGLNTGLTQLGVDLSGVTDLSEAEKSAVAWRFGELHGIVPLEATWEELAEEGYIDAEQLTWKENGCLFTLSGSAEDGFEAEKWASGLGAYFFLDCTARQASDRTWTYEVGAEAIS